MLLVARFPVIVRQAGFSDEAVDKFQKLFRALDSETVLHLLVSRCCLHTCRICMASKDDSPPAAAQELSMLEFAKRLRVEVRGWGEHSAATKAARLLRTSWWHSVENEASCG